AATQRPIAALHLQWDTGCLPQQSFFSRRVVGVAVDEWISPIFVDVRDSSLLQARFASDTYVLRFVGFSILSDQVALASVHGHVRLVANVALGVILRVL